MIPDRTSTPEARTSRASLPNERIASWLRSKVAELLGTSATEVADDRSFVELGLDSVMLACVAGELEIFLRREIGPDLLHRHPTIATLSLHLAGTSTEGALA